MNKFEQKKKKKVYFNGKNQIAMPNFNIGIYYSWMGREHTGCINKMAQKLIFFSLAEQVFYIHETPSHSAL